MMPPATSLARTSLARTLAQLGFLEGTPPEVLARFAAHARCIEAGRDGVVIDFADPTTDVFFVLQGRVRVLLRTADGERVHILGDVGAGEMVGEMAAIDDAPRSARVEALTRTRLCVVPAAAFMDLVLSSSPAGLRLLRLLTARIRVQTQRLMEHTALPIARRLAAELLRLSRPRPDGTLVVSPPPTQEELGSRVGARRETVSREIGAMARAGLLHRTRQAYVLDRPERLRTMAAPPDG